MIFIRNGHIKTMAGADLENGCLLLGDDGKIAAVGTDIACPPERRYYSHFQFFKKRIECPVPLDFPSQNAT